VNPPGVPNFVGADKVMARKPLFSLTLPDQRRRHPSDADDVPA
jgi:hypothetical protein